MKNLFGLTFLLLSGLFPFVGQSQVPNALQPDALNREVHRNRGLAPIHLSGLPEEAKSNISGALGRDSRSYRVHAQGMGFRVENARHRLIADFTSQGVSMHAGSMTWKMALRRFGYGDALQEVESAAPKANLNRVEYQHRAFTEWYVNGPVGLEHGLTVYQPPPGADDQPLTMALALSGDLKPAVDSSGTSVTLTRRHGGAELRYGGLLAFDSAGMPLRAWFDLRGDQLLVKVREKGARFPIVIDPWIQMAKLTASDGRAWDEVGYSVASSGNTIAVGAPGVTIGTEKLGDDAGAVYVFVKPSNGWANSTQVAKLWASDGKLDDDLGTSVAISGNTVVAGAPHFVEAPWRAGAVYVFVKPASGWRNMTQTAKLTPSTRFATDFFGYRVSTDANTVVAGAPTQQPFVSPGAAYVFVKPASGWRNMTQTAKLTTNVSKAPGLGRDISISGNVVVAAARSSTSFVYVKPLTGWKNMIQTAKLTPSVDAQFGIMSVAISGNTVVTGSPAAPIRSHQNQGAAFVFVKPPNGWVNTEQTALLTASDGAVGDHLGFSTAVVGNTVVLGAPTATVRGQKGEGAAYLFVKPANGWKNMTQTGKLIEALGAPYDNFGTSVAISGSTNPAVFIGAIQTPPRGAAGKGATYAFSVSP